MKQVCPRYLPTWVENLCIHTTWPTNVYSSLIHNCQILQATKISFNSWMDKQTVVPLNTEILFSNKKKWAIKPQKTWKNLKHRASLVAQWLRVCLPMQGTRVRALVWEDPTCRGATRPVSRNYWACASGACAPQQERPRQWEACAPRWRVAPACRN